MITDTRRSAAHRALDDAFRDLLASRVPLVVTTALVSEAAKMPPTAPAADLFDLERRIRGHIVRANVESSRT